MPPLKSVPKSAPATTPAPAAAVPAKKPPLDLSAVLRSSDDAELEGDIVIHGPPKHGKTFLAASASEFFPEDMDELGSGKKFELDDMLWVSFDDGATAGFRGAGLKVRELSFRPLLAQKPLPDALDLLAALVKKAFAAHPVKYIVGDTISMLDRMLVDYYATLHESSENTFAMWKDVLRRHMRFRAAMSAIPAEKIYNFHSKAQLEASQKTPDQRARADAAKLPGGEAITPDISGQARTAYIGNSSLELTIKCLVAPGKGKREVRRVVYPYGSGGFEGSNRYHHVLEYEEEPHLRHIFEKIRGKR